MSGKINYHKSIGQELMSVKNRVRNLLGDETHWLSDGKFKEAILKSVLSRHLPENIGAYNGFSVLRNNSATTEIDLILARKDQANLFKQDDFIITTPSNVFGAIEVKTSVDKTQLQFALHKLSDNAEKIRSDAYVTHLQKNFDGRDRDFAPWFGLFSYEWKPSEDILSIFNDAADSNFERVINCACLGPDHFVRFWRGVKEEYDNDPFTGWELYRLDGLAVAYFIANMIWQGSKSTIESDNWFPLHKGKGSHSVARQNFTITRN